MNHLTYLAALVMCIALPAHGISNRQPTEKDIAAASTERAAMTEVAVAPKPRVSYSAFIAAQKPVAVQKPQHRQHSIAAAIQWRLDESIKPGARKMGDSWAITLRFLQRQPIASKQIPELIAQDFVDHCRDRIAAGRKPCTANHDITAFRSAISDYIESNDLPGEWLMVFKKAKRRLNKEQLIGKSTPRTRLPTLEELHLFREHYAKQNEHPLCFTDMVLVLDGLVLTGRRISELTRIERQHVDVAKKTYWVYDLKNSKGKGHHGEAALIEGAWELFERRLTEIPNEPTARFFPFEAKTCSQRATKAKKHLMAAHPGLFLNLRMHDNRAYCFTELFKKRYTVLQVQKGISLHKTDKVLVASYARIHAVDLHAGPLGMPLEQRMAA
jgi:integrase